MGLFSDISAHKNWRFVTISGNCPLFFVSPQNQPPPFRPFTGYLCHTLQHGNREGSLRETKTMSGFSSPFMLIPDTPNDPPPRSGHPRGFPEMPRPSERVSNPFGHSFSTPVFSFSSIRPFTAIGAGFFFPPPPSKTEVIPHSVPFFYTPSRSPPSLSIAIRCVFAVPPLTF